MRLMFAGGLMVVAGAFWGIQKINHAVNYVPVMASVTSVKTGQCFLQRVERGLMTKTTETTDQMSCDRADMLRTTHPAYKGMRAKGYMDVSFTFVSPVDNQQHSGTMTYAHEDYGKLATAYAGTQLPILAHKSDADSTAHDYDRMESFSTKPE